ncbi:Calcium-activated potassium channel subunit alpha-1 (BK channel) (BKCA alpha) (Calcium-activated potassium channel [Durusdinium trenchii]|uniref:Subfamily M subunit alpha-1 (K(VCA)alpha (KCa1.1 (Maxi K channel (MaxiK (Slo-alpha (Slo1 (Slowpoke homolog (Slo homolog (CSlo n=1 Tax=Durusdinium trenchii TaxID=1381693 RepID=A0ABP0IZH2_9DINO
MASPEASGGGAAGRSSTTLKVVASAKILSRKLLGEDRQGDGSVWTAWEEIMSLVWLFVTEPKRRAALLGSLCGLLSCAYFALGKVGVLGMTADSAGFAIFNLVTTSYLTIDYISLGFASRWDKSFTLSLLGVVEFASSVLMQGMLLHILLWPESHTVAMELEIFYVMMTLRVFRLLRVEIFIQADFSKRAFRFFIQMFGLLFVFSALITAAEEIDIADVAYTIVISISTVGYGDVVLVTPLGRWLIMVLILTTMVSIPMSTQRLFQVNKIDTRNSIVSARRLRNQRRISNHILVCGPIQSGLLSFFDEIFHTDHGAKKPQVLVLSNNPGTLMNLGMVMINRERAHCISTINGSPLCTKALTRGGLQRAQKIYLLGDCAAVNPEENDRFTILSFMTIFKARGTCAGFSNGDDSRERSMQDSEAASSGPLARGYTTMGRRQNFYVKILLVKSQRLLHHMLLESSSPDVRRHVHVLCAEQAKLQIFAKSCVCPGFSTFVGNLFRSVEFKQSTGQNTGERDPTLLSWEQEYMNGASYEIYKTPLGTAFAGLTFLQVAQVLYETVGILPIALSLSHSSRSLESVFLNPAHFIVPEDVTRQRLALYVLAKNRAQADLANLCERSSQRSDTISSVSSLASKTVRRLSTAMVSGSVLNFATESKQDDSAKKKFLSKAKVAGTSPMLSVPTDGTKKNVQAPGQALKRFPTAGGDNGNHFHQARPSPKGPAPISLGVATFVDDDETEETSVAREKPGTAVPKLQTPLSPTRSTAGSSVFRLGSKANLSKRFLSPSARGSSASRGFTFRGFGTKRSVMAEDSEANLVSTRMYNAIDVFRAENIQATSEEQDRVLEEDEEGEEEEEKDNESQDHCGVRSKRILFRSSVAKQLEKETVVAPIDGQQKRDNKDMMWNLLGSSAESIRSKYSLFKEPVLQSSVTVETTLLEDFPSVRDHVVLYAGTSDITDFLLPLRLRAGGGIVPVVLITEMPVEEGIWQRLGYFPSLYVVLGHVGMEMTWRRAGIRYAARVILASASPKLMEEDDTVHGKPRGVGVSEADDSVEDNVADEEAFQEKNLDGQTICLYNMVLRENKNVQICCEVQRKENISLLQHRSSMQSKEASGNMLLSPMYASGNVLSADAFDTLMAQTYYNEPLMRILQLLISGSSGQNFHKGVENSNFYALNVTPEMTASSYGAIFRSLCRRGVMPICLRRCVQKRTNLGIMGNRMPYVVTNPEANAKVFIGDTIFCLAQENPLFFLSVPEYGIKRSVPSFEGSALVRGSSTRELAMKDVMEDALQNKEKIQRHSPFDRNALRKTLLREATERQRRSSGLQLPSSNADIKSIDDFRQSFQEQVSKLKITLEALSRKA